MEKHITPTVSDICDAIGRSTIASAVGVGLTAVSNAAVAGKFPAKWFPIIRKLCVDAGISCDEQHFSFVGIAHERERRAQQQEGASP